MIYILYPFLVLINLMGTVLTFPLAPLLVVFKSTRYGWLDNATKIGFGPRLWNILGWFQTPDNSLDGDRTFVSLNPPSYWSRVKWLWRNPFYGFAVRTFDGSTGMSYSGDLNCNEKNPGHILVKGHGLFQWVYTKHIGSKCLYLSFGWNIRSLVDQGFLIADQWHDNSAFINQYTATFAFSPRLVSY